MQKKPIKMLQYDVIKLLPGNPLDDSYLGYHVKSVQEVELANLQPGIVLLGLADDTGIANVGGRLGARSGPGAVRGKLFKFTSGAFKFPFYDLGDIEPMESIETTHEGISELIKKIHTFGHTPLLIGGGHDLAFPESQGLVKAFPGRQLTVVNIDAHLDVRPVKEKITSGSPYFLLAETPEYKAGLVNVIEFGIQKHCNARSLYNYAIDRKFQIVELGKIRQNIQKNQTVEKQFLKLLQQTAPKKKAKAKPKAGNTQVSLDIDSVTWAYAPGCSAPQVSGFSPEEALQMSFTAGQQSRVSSFGIYELSPPLDPDGRTAALVAHCVLHFLNGFSERKKTK